MTEIREYEEPRRHCDGFSKDYLTAIGMVAVEGAWAEMSVQLSIWALSGESFQDGIARTQKLSMKQRVKELRSTTKAKFPQDSRGIDEIMDAILDANRERNDVIHAFAHDPSEQNFHGFSIPPGKGDAKYLDYTPKDIDNIAEHIHAAMGNLGAFLTERKVTFPLVVIEYSV